VPNSPPHCHLEKNVLSPHEFAALMLVKNAPDQIERDRIDLAALLERDLVSFDHPDGNRRRPALTASGHSVLDAAARYWSRPGPVVHISEIQTIASNRGLAVRWAFRPTPDGVGPKGAAIDAVGKRCGGNAKC